MATINVSQRLHDRLGRIIAVAEPGARLLSEPALGKELGVSRATLREAAYFIAREAIVFSNREGGQSGKDLKSPSGALGWQGWKWRAGLCRQAFRAGPGRGGWRTVRG